MAVAAHNADGMVGILRDTIVSLVRRDGPDLSARQLGVFLTCYLQDGPHTVRGLAADLNVSKPAITRALDRLGELELARRKVDPSDRRSVLVQRGWAPRNSSTPCDEQASDALLISERAVSSSADPTTVRCRSMRQPNRLSRISQPSTSMRAAYGR